MRLLNFSGKPYLATTLAAKNTLDEDEGMRNNAVRLSRNKAPDSGF
jgi:hypothetical protein